jgi:heme exporter protein D
MSEFFAMGGYGAFVWPAYAVTLLGLGAAIFLTWRAYRAAQRSLSVLESDKP